MNKIITSEYLSNVESLNEVNACAMTGIGLWTGICVIFCQILGKKSKHYMKKMKKITNLVNYELTKKADLLNADGVMGVRYSLYNLSIIAYGVAFKFPNKSETPIDLKSKTQKPSSGDTTKNIGNDFFKYNDPVVFVKDFYATELQTRILANTKGKIVEVKKTGEILVDVELPNKKIMCLVPKEYISK